MTSIVPIDTTLHTGAIAYTSIRMGLSASTIRTILPPRYFANANQTASTYTVVYSHPRHGTGSYRAQAPSADIARQRAYELLADDMLTDDTDTPEERSTLMDELSIKIIAGNCTKYTIAYRHPLHGTGHYRVHAPSADAALENACELLTDDMLGENPDTPDERSRLIADLSIDVYAGHHKHAPSAASPVARLVPIR